MVELVDYPKPNPKPLNGSQFSQGTLFQPPKPSPEHRWAAHGYSPERREAIRQAIPEKNVGTYTGGWIGHPLYPVAHEVASMRDVERGEVTEKRVQQLMSSQLTRTRNNIVDVLDRSTAPVEDIAKNTPEIQVDPNLEAWG